MIPIVTGELWTIPQRIGKGTGRLGNKRSEDHPDNSIVKIGWNTDKRSLKLEETCHLNSSEKPSANAGAKNS